MFLFGSRYGRFSCSEWVVLELLETKLPEISSQGFDLACLLIECVIGMIRYRSMFASSEYTINNEKLSTLQVFLSISRHVTLVQSYVVKLDLKVASLIRQRICLAMLYNARACTYEDHAGLDCGEAQCELLNFPGIRVEAILIA